MALSDTRGCITPPSADGPAPTSSERRGAGVTAPTVELEVDAGDELRLAAREVHRGRGDVAGLAEPGEMHRLQPVTPLGCQIRVATLVDHVSGADGVAPDSLRRVLHRDGARQRVQAAFAGGV